MNIQQQQINNKQNNHQPLPAKKPVGVPGAPIRPKSS
jgi:hypothetical protein